MDVKDHILMQGKKIGFGLIATLMAGLPAISPVSAAQSPQVRMDPSNIPQFAQALPGLDLGAVVGTGPTGVGLKVYVGADAIVGSTEIHICEFDASVLPSGTPGVTAKTRSWGYIVGTACPAPGTPEYTQDSYIGPVLVNVRNLPSTLRVVNDLGNADTTGVLAYKYSVDQTVHWADPLNPDDRNRCNHLANEGGIPSPTDACAQNYAGSIPAAVHLHGSLIPPELDGGPDAWVTSNGIRGHGYYTSDPAAPANGFTYKYPNAQEASALIFHDHVLGNLRLNLYAGIAAGYIIEDNTIIPNNATGVWGSKLLLPPSALCDPDSKKCLPSNLPGTAEIIPVIIQDRIFDVNGQLFWPADSAGGTQSSPNPEHPYWAPDFLGDTIVVNGKAWPYHEVEPKRYRFLFINASHSRIYNLNLGIPFYVIATDGGYLDKPAKVDNLLITSGERYEVIIDFAGHNGHNMVLTNNAAGPYPNGSAPEPSTLGKVMEFRIASAVTAPDASYDPASKKPVRGKKAKLVRLVKPTKGKLAVKKSKVAATRQFIFNNVIGEPQTAINPVTGVETAYPGGELEILANNTKWSGTNRSDFTPITLGGVTNYYSEFNREGNIEVVEFVNLTEESHAQHLHGTTFQVLNRQEFDTGAYTAAYNGAFPGGAFIPGFGPPLDYNPSTASGNKYGGNPDVKPYLEGKALRPRPEEAGWKDTVITLPGQVTRVAVRYAPTDLSTKTKAADLYFPFDPSGNTQYGFVHHCHMTEHEDNEMMRPNLVTLNPDAPAPASRPLKKGVDY
jgi:FtsP/CotA-like multicopper oxidase with cupredoxin domain